MVRHPGDRLPLRRCTPIGSADYPAEVEATVCFSCPEALQNAAKHARGATHATILVWQDQALHFEVREDGAGFDLPTMPYGTGLGNLSDRLVAVGGTMRIQSTSDEGTVLEGSILFV